MPIDRLGHAHRLQDKRTAHQARNLRQNREDGHRKNRRDDTRQDEEADRRKPHRRQCIQLLVHFHRADLRRKRASRTAREDDGRNDRSKFTEKRNRQHVRNVNLDAEHLESRCTLERKNDTQQETDANRHQKAVERRTLERHCRIAQTELTRPEKRRHGATGGFTEKSQKRRIRTHQSCANADETA